MIGQKMTVKDGNHVNAGYYVTMPNGQVKYVANGDAETRAAVVAAWKPVNDAKKAKREQEDAARKAE